MLTRCFTPRSFLMFLALGLLSMVVAGPHLVRAGGFFRNGAVGGVSIDAQGVVRQPSDEERRELRQEIERRLVAVPQELDNAGPALRRISLRQLEKAIQDARRNGGELPEEVRYLAGLQRVQYVLVYPEHKDVVLIGQAEGWRTNEQGHVVGKTTGQPVLQLEDLAVAFRAHFAEPSVINCSIDPTPEGTQALQKFLRQQDQFAPAVLDGMERALGPQQITLSGVPESSHFARVLVAADYRMKRIAMMLDESPLEDLPSFLEMLGESRAKLTNMMPRWWLACDYEPLGRSDDGLAWELRGPGVRVMTEDSIIANDGTFEAQSGKENPIASKWAERMTNRYEPLSKAEPVFGQLRNLMDMSVIAALIRKEQLLEKAGLELPTLLGADQNLPLTAWNPPKSLATECSYIKRGRDYLITASGGVQIDAWRNASEVNVSRSLDLLSQAHPHQADRWWW